MFFKDDRINYDYIPLLVALIAAALLARFLGQTQILLVVLTLSVSFVYVAWGVVHHKKSGHIDRKIVLEYAGIALLANIIVITLVS